MARRDWRNFGLDLLAQVIARVARMGAAGSVMITAGACRFRLRPGAAVVVGHQWRRDGREREAGSTFLIRSVSMLRNPVDTRHPPPRAYSVEDASRIAGVCRSTLYLAIGAGTLVSLKIGRRRLIQPEALEAWLASHAQIKA
jgi:excisionase family DNA binding protein